MPAEMGVAVSDADAFACVAADATTPLSWTPLEGADMDDELQPGCGSA
jgi:hypothetical protein